jgi:hypothetical protein
MASRRDSTVYPNAPAAQRQDPFAENAAARDPDHRRASFRPDRARVSLVPEDARSGAHCRNPRRPRRRLGGGELDGPDVAQTTEMFFPVDQALVKSPAATWRAYGPLFRKHSTPVIETELLAALAQIEGAGNPVARPRWTWRWSRNPFEWYRPASSAVGMFQITDAALRDAKRYCIHDHAMVEDGPWYDLNSCWFNGLYARVVPSHAIEMTSALLDRSVASTLAQHKLPAATLRQKHDLAAIIHLCGAARGEAFARRGFVPAAGERCGTQDLRSYLLQLNDLKRRFAALAAD